MNMDPQRMQIRKACEAMAKGLALVENTPRVTQADEALRARILNHAREIFVTQFGVPAEFLARLRV
jgi:hypothetical protein